MDILKKGTCLVVQILCWAALTLLTVWLIATESGESVNPEVMDRAAMVAAAQEYDRVMEEYGDPIAANAVAQARYEELGGTRESWQVRAQ